MNRALVLRELRERPGSSRRDLAAGLGLDRSTISNITGELMEAGVIAKADAETGHAAGRGRPAVGLRVVDERLCAVGLEITEGGYRAVVRDNAGAVRHRESGDRRFPEYVRFGDGLSELVSDIASRAERKRSADGAPVRIVGAGCAVPGAVDSREARLIRSRELSLSDEPLPVHCRSGERTIPIVCDNDAHCGAWGEVHAWTRAGMRGAGARDGESESAPANEAASSTRANLLFVLGRSSVRHLGVGMGLVIDGMVRYGGTHTAGEFYSGRWAGDEGSQFSLSPAALARASGERSLREQVFKELCEGLVPVVSVTDPQAVVFGGFFREHFDEIAAAARTHVAGERILGLFASSRLAADEIAGGAAALFHEQLFRVPRYDRNSGAAPVGWEDVIEFLKETV